MLTRSKITVFLSLALICLFCGSQTMFAQATDAKGQMIVKLGSIDPKMTGSTSMNAILAQPKLWVSSDYVVTGYKVSFVTHEANGKEAHFGPFEVKGAELSQQIKDYMKKYEHAKSKIVIEDIQVMGGGMVTKGGPLTLSYN